jgi:hypothetical protein
MSCHNCKNDCSIMFNVAIPVMVYIKLDPDGELEIVGRSEKPSARIPRSGVCSICNAEVPNPVPLEQWTVFLKENMGQLADENIEDEYADNAGTD